MAGAGGNSRPSLPPWFDGLARILRMVEEEGMWLEGFAGCIHCYDPKSDGDATPLGQRPFCVVPVGYCSWSLG